MKRFREVFKPGTDYMVFFASMAAMGLAYGLYKGVLNNYLAEIVSMTEFDRGVSEFFRELPGLCLVFILAMLYTFSAEKIYKLGSVIMLIGMALHAVVPAGIVWIIIAICVYSLGEHIQLGMESTICLQYAQEGKGGLALGFQKSVGEVGNLLGYILIAILFSFTAGSLTAYRGVFAVCALICFAGVYYAFRMKSNSQTDQNKRRFYFHKKYTKYYLLEVFYGARKQVFITFGPYVLILFYGASAQVISILFAVSALADFFCAPLVGKIIDKLGYKIVMIADTLILVVVCFFYGFAHHLFSMDTAFLICCVNYVLDSIISLASMASKVYVQSLSDNADETKATLSTGVSVNHMITILIALFGGWIWAKLGIETLFMVSAVLGLCNSAYAATIESEKKA